MVSLRFRALVFKMKKRGAPYLFFKILKFCLFTFVPQSFRHLFTHRDLWKLSHVFVIVCLIFCFLKKKSRRIFTRPFLQYFEILKMWRKGRGQGQVKNHQRFESPGNHQSQDGGNMPNTQFQHQVGSWFQKT
jgi:hypothetical protein